MTDIEAISGELAERVQRAAGSVVRIHAGCRAGGSGLVWSARVVVTAAHHLGHDEVTEVGIDGQREDAKLIGSDPATDLAALEVGRDLTPFTAADPGGLKVGQLVLGLGRAGDGLRANLGTLAALGGAFRLAGGASVDRYIETDLRQRPGFSGSALLGVSGELIGMNTSGIVRGTPVALPVSTLARVVDALVQHGRVPRNYLGVSVQSVRLPPQLHAELGQRAGLVVLGVEPGGPAEAAGVGLGDVLLRLGAERLRRVFELQAALSGLASETRTELELLRAGERRTIEITPRARS
jgi:S1-C subfamily serine protease